MVSSEEIKQPYDKQNLLIEYDASVLAMANIDSRLIFQQGLRDGFLLAVEQLAVQNENKAVNKDTLERPRKALQASFTGIRKGFVVGWLVGKAMVKSCRDLTVYMALYKKGGDTGQTRGKFFCRNGKKMVNL